MDYAFQIPEDKSKEYHKVVEAMVKEMKRMLEERYKIPLKCNFYFSSDELIIKLKRDDERIEDEK